MSYIMNSIVQMQWMVSSTYQHWRQFTEIEQFLGNNWSSTHSVFLMEVGSQLTPHHYSWSLRCCFNTIKTQAKLVFVSLSLGLRSYFVHVKGLASISRHTCSGGFDQASSKLQEHIKSSDCYTWTASKKPTSRFIVHYQYNYSAILRDSQRRITFENSTQSNYPSINTWGKIN